MINNAGVMAIPEKQLSADGIEMQVASNHIGHFVLVNLIMPKLLAAAKTNPAGATRIVNVSSFGHNLSPARLSDVNFDKPASSIPENERKNKELESEYGLKSVC